MKKKTLSVCCSIMAALLIGGGVAAGVYYGKKAYDDKKPASSENTSSQVSSDVKSDASSTVKSDASSVVSSETTSSGISVKMAKISDTEYDLTYTVTGTVGKGDIILVSEAWTDTAYTGVITDYFTITHIAASKTVKIVVKKVFTKQLTITLKSAKDATKKATCTVDYKERLVSVEPNITFTENAVINPVYNIVGSGGTIALDKSVKSASFKIQPDPNVFNTYFQAHHSEMGLTTWTSGCAIEAADEWDLTINSTKYDSTTLLNGSLTDRDQTVYATFKDFPQSVIEEAFAQSAILTYTLTCDNVQRTEAFDPTISFSSVTAITTDTGGVIF